MSKSLTLKDATSQLRLIGMTLRSNSIEYRVNFHGGTEDTAYYTDDLADAVATGKMMRVERNKTINCTECFRIGHTNGHDDHT